jgi:CubicO group peptidase (beta-lactamase class C family)
MWLRVSSISIMCLSLPVAVVLAGPGPQVEAAGLNEKVVGALEAIRVREGLPALAGAIVTSDGVLASGVVGVRKCGASAAATLQDDWYFGSCTKIMTATLIGRLIDDGKLRFGSTIADVFPDLASNLPETVREISVEQLLTHRAGLPWEADWIPLSQHGSLIDQRLATVLAAGRVALVAAPGTRFSYSNWDYVILGAMAERITGRSWEELMRQQIFAPLKMEHVGFGGTGTPGQIDQPWPHVRGFPMFSNGPGIDFPAVVAPAASVHCPIGEWAKFIQNELRGLRGEPSLLSASTFQHLYASEAVVKLERDWARGIAYHHSGTNNMNYADVWLAPKRNVAFVTCANDGIGEKGCDDAAKALIKLYDTLGR